MSADNKNLDGWKNEKDSRGGFFPGANHPDGIGLATAMKLLQGKNIDYAVVAGRNDLSKEASGVLKKADLGDRVFFEQFDVTAENATARLLEIIESGFIAEETINNLKTVFVTTGASSHSAKNKSEGENDGLENYERVLETNFAVIKNIIFPLFEHLVENNISGTTVANAGSFSSEAGKIGLDGNAYATSKEAQSTALKFLQNCTTEKNLKRAAAGEEELIMGVLDFIYWYIDTRMTCGNSDVNQPLDLETAAEMTAEKIGKAMNKVESGKSVDRKHYIPNFLCLKKRVLIGIMRLLEKITGGRKSVRKELVKTFQKNIAANKTKKIDE